MSYPAHSSSAITSAERHRCGAGALSMSWRISHSTPARSRPTTKLRSSLWLAWLSRSPLRHGISNMHGVCSPAGHVAYRQDGRDAFSAPRLHFTINKYADPSRRSPRRVQGRLPLPHGGTSSRTRSASMRGGCCRPAQGRRHRLSSRGGQRGRAYVEKRGGAAFREALDALEDGRPMSRPACSPTEGIAPPRSPTVRPGDELTLAPVLFNWAPEALADFPFRSPEMRRSIA